MYLADKKRIIIGNLGEFVFLPGDYVYVGSAMGTGLLRARLNRHLRSDKKKNWHLDWLVPHVMIRGICYHVGREKLECNWVQMMINQEGAVYPVSGFGAGDCTMGCGAHLMYLSNGISLEKICLLLNAHSLMSLEADV